MCIFQQLIILTLLNPHQSPSPRHVPKLTPTHSPSHRHTHAWIHVDTCVRSTPHLHPPSRHIHVYRTCTLVVRGVPTRTRTDAPHTRQRIPHHVHSGCRVGLSRTRPTYTPTHPRPHPHTRTRNRLLESPTATNEESSGVILGRDGNFK